MVTVEPILLPSRKEGNMAGTRVGKNKYYLIYQLAGLTQIRTYTNFKDAVSAYRRARKVCGNEVVLTQVIIDNGENV